MRSRGIALAVTGLAACAFSQTVTMTAPPADAEFEVGDTVNVTYSADDMFVAVAVGIEVELSPDKGRHWFSLVPVENIENPEHSNDYTAVSFREAYSGSIHVVIPDTVSSSKYRDEEGDPLPFATASDSAKLRVVGYGDKSLYDVIDVTVMPKPESGTNGDEGCGAGVFAVLVPLLATRLRRPSGRRVRH